MTRTKAQPKPLPTIWEIPDELWRRIEPILKQFWPRKATGRKVPDWRKMLNGIIFRMRSGCQWEKLPERYGPKSTVHDWFQRWVQGGIFEKIWAVLVAEIFSKMPPWTHRWNQSWTVLLGPYRSGSWSHWQPLRIRKMIPLSIFRQLATLRPVGFLGQYSLRMGSIRRQSSSGISQMVGTGF